MSVFMRAERHQPSRDVLVARGRVVRERRGDRTPRRSRARSRRRTAARRRRPASGPPRSASPARRVRVGQRARAWARCDTGSARPAASGWRSARCSATKPPAEWPKTIGRSMPGAQSAATSSAICSSVHDCDGRGCRAALSAQVDEDDLRVVGQRRQAGAEVAVIEARARRAGRPSWGGIAAASPATASCGPSTSKYSSVWLTVMRMVTPEMHRTPRKFDRPATGRRAFELFATSARINRHVRCDVFAAASSRPLEPQRTTAARRAGEWRHDAGPTTPRSRAPRRPATRRPGRAARAPPRAPARCRRRDARPRPRRRRRRPRRVPDRPQTDRRAARAGRRRRLAGRHRGQRLPRAAAPPRPRAAGRAMPSSRAARSTRVAGRPSSAARCATGSGPRSSACPSPSAWPSCCATSRRASSYAAIADICDVPVGTVRSRLNAARSATRR